MNIADILEIKKTSISNLNTLVGIDQMQHVLGFDAAVDVVFLEASKYRDAEGYITTDNCIILCQFCSDNQEWLDCRGKNQFYQGMYDAYQLCKDLVNTAINTPILNIM